MPIIAIAGADRTRCRIPRCVEAIWLNKPKEIYIYFDILVDNSQESVAAVGSLSIISHVDLTGDVGPALQNLFPENMNRSFPSDLSFSFFEEIPENRFIVSVNTDQRTVERRPPYGPGWDIPQNLVITCSPISNRGKRALGTLVNIAPQPSILPGHKANLRLLFKVGEHPCVADLARSYRKSWTGVRVTQLTLRAFDCEPLVGGQYRIENVIPTDDYRLLFVTPPQAEDLEFTQQPNSIIHHEFKMLNPSLGDPRLTAEWHIAPNTDRPVRMRGKYIQHNAFNWEFLIVLLSMLAGFISLAIDLWQLLVNLSLPK